MDRAAVWMSHTDLPKTSKLPLVLHGRRCVGLGAIQVALKLPNDGVFCLQLGIHFFRVASSSKLGLQ